MLTDGDESWDFIVLIDGCQYLEYYAQLSCKKASVEIQLL